MKRVHNTIEKDLVLCNREQAPVKLNNHLKPHGIWYGIDDGWLDWCKSEMPGWVKPYNYELEVDLSKMLVISTEAQLRAFNKKFFVQSYPDLGIEFGVINWLAVSWEVAGVEVNPYLYECRFEHALLWYYGWDCPSGCIWDISVITAVRRL